MLWFNRVSHRRVPSLHCTVSCVRTCGLHHLKTHAHTCIDSMLSRLAAKQLSVIVASGPSSLAAQEVKVPISSPIPLCFLTIRHCVLLVICAHCTKILVTQKYPNSPVTLVLIQCVPFRCSLWNWLLCLFDAVATIRIR